MQSVIFLTGIVAEQRHHFQVRTCPRATFFNGVNATNKLTAAILLPPP